MKRRIVWWRFFGAAITAVMGIVLLVNVVVSAFEQRWAYVGVYVALLVLAVLLGVARVAAWQDSLEGGPRFDWARRNP